jgi:hypothetical protein
LIHPDSSLGVIFFVTLFLTILITTVSVRGLASVIVILTVTEARARHQSVATPLSTGDLRTPIPD